MQEVKKVVWNKGKRLSREHKEKLSQSHKNRKYKEWKGKISKICYECNEIFKVFQCDKNNKFCSRNCFYKWNGKIHKGENSHLWKGGITPERNKIRSSLEYKLWSDSVWNRDDNCCQKCKENRISNLVAHHIKNFAQFPELRFAIDNGMTFCRTCHKEFHKKYGKKNNSLEQIKEFLC